MFNKQYICLVSGLREYTLESDAKGLDMSTLLEEIHDEVSSRDWSIVSALYGYYDCENIAAAYAGRNNHNPLGQIPRETIEDMLRGGDKGTLLQEVAAVISAYTTKGGDVSDRAEQSQIFTRQLFAAYYEACSTMKSRFLRSCCDADRNLRNVAAAITARSTARAIADVVVGGGDVVEQLLRSSAADFGLRGELSYIDSVITAVSEEQDMIEKEHKIDMVRWELSDQLAEMEYFSLDFVLAYLVKVNIVARWRALDPERGREIFEKLVAGLSGKDLVNNK